jgi:hypothetical protein
LKKDDHFFKQNIYYYFDKTTNLTMYYNAQDLNYLGYKAQGKNYTRINGSGKTLQINTSIKNKLLFLGYPYLHYKIPTDIQNMLKEKDTITDNNKIITFFLLFKNVK